MRLLTLALALLVGCSATDPCTEARQVVDVRFGEPEHTIGEIALESTIAAGYSCNSSEPLNNAFGNRIGTRYICERCT